MESHDLDFFVSIIIIICYDKKRENNIYICNKIENVINIYAKRVSFKIIELFISKLSKAK